MANNIPKAYEDFVNKLVEYAEGRSKAMLEGDYEDFLNEVFDVSDFGDVEDIAESFDRKELAQTFIEQYSNGTLNIGALNSLVAMNDLMAAAHKAFTISHRTRQQTFAAGASRYRGGSNSKGFLKHALMRIPLAEQQD